MHPTGWLCRLPPPSGHGCGSWWWIHLNAPTPPMFAQALDTSQPTRRAHAPLRVGLPVRIPTRADRQHLSPNGQFHITNVPAKPFRPSMTASRAATSSFVSNEEIRRVLVGRLMSLSHGNSMSSTSRYKNSKALRAWYGLRQTPCVQSPASLEMLQPALPPYRADAS